MKQLNKGIVSGQSGIPKKARLWNAVLTNQGFLIQAVFYELMPGCTPSQGHSLTLHSRRPQGCYPNSLLPLHASHFPAPSKWVLPGVLAPTLWVPHSQLFTCPLPSSSCTCALGNVSEGLASLWPNSWTDLLLSGSLASLHNTPKVKALPGCSYRPL